MAERVLAAQKIQVRRFGEDSSTPLNAAMGPEDLRLFCHLEPDARRLLDMAFERLRLSAQAQTRILKVGRTIADLEASEAIRAPHIGEAIQYRSLDRQSGGGLP